MSGRAWFMMFFLLTIVWGGFIALLLYSLRKKAALYRKTDAQDEGKAEN